MTAARLNRKSHSGIHTRLAAPRDAKAIAPLVNDSFSVETFLEGTRTDELQIRKMLQKGEFLVAEDSTGRIVASVYIEITGQRGYFGMLAVHPSQQGKGLGRLMIEAAEEHCRRHGCTFMEIFILSLRTELPPLYHKFGYVESRTEEFRPSRVLREGLECHCIVMSKTL